MLEVSLPVAIAIVVVGLLLLRFVVKTAITLVKIGLLVGIAVAVFFAIQALTG